VACVKQKAVGILCVVHEVVETGDAGVGAVADDQMKLFCDWPAEVETRPTANNAKSSFFILSCRL